MSIQNDRASRLILASRSAVRRRILEGVGLRIEVAPADLDETRILAELEAAKAPMAERAARLAAVKAEAVQARVDAADAVVIGSDQILVLDGAALEAPGDRAATRDRLWALRGRPHQLVSGVAVARPGVATEIAVETAMVAMRSYSAAELDGYLERAPDWVYGTVGGYALEGLGAQLVEQVKGDWHAALGMPLWPLLAMLRNAAASQGETA